MVNTEIEKKSSSWFHAFCGRRDDLPRWIGFLSISLAFVILNNVFSLTPQLPQTTFYIILIAISVLLLQFAFKGRIAVNGSMWCFWGMMWFSIIANDISAHFQPSYRTIAFLLVLCVTAPYFHGLYLNRIRDRVFDVLNMAMLFMAFLSFLGKIFSFLPADRQGYYLGCTHHSMDLSCLSGVALVYALHLFTVLKEHDHLRRLLGIVSLGTLVVLFYCSSRTSIISGIIAVLAYYGAGGSRAVLKVIKPLLVLCLMLVVIDVMFPDAMSGVLHKSGGDGLSDVSITSLTSSRREIWEARLMEIKESPIFGIGAHSIKYGRSSASGTIEPGNAWLYVFSSMGIFSFILFCGMMLQAMLRCLRYAQPGRNASLVLGILVYFSFYMIGEAHITAVGEFSCSYFWLLLSVALYHNFQQDENTGQNIALATVA